MWNLSAIEKSLEYEKKGIVSTTAVLNFLTMNFRVWQLSTPLKIVFDAMMTHKIQYQWVIRNHTPSGVWILNQFFDILKLSQVKPTVFKILKKPETGNRIENRNPDQPEIFMDEPVWEYQFACIGFFR